VVASYYRNRTRERRIDSHDGLVRPLVLEMTANASYYDSHSHNCYYQIIALKSLLDLLFFVKNQS
jgi:hypothetical protein